jgi:energy-coupling factor transport system ATP-binding protein
MNPNTLNRKEKILVLLALSIIHKPKILFLDDICVMMNRCEKKVILDILHKLNKEWGITIVMSTLSLEEAVTADYIYIINNGKIALSGKPLDVLKDDNVINKLGLSMPFMIDLSIKLKDYDLVDDVILDMEGMVDLLWK